jgi:hypothetical protein
MSAFLLEDANVIGLLKRREAAGQAEFDAQANPGVSASHRLHGNTDCGYRPLRRSAATARCPVDAKLCVDSMADAANVYPAVLSTRNPGDAKHHDSPVPVQHRDRVRS